MGNVIDLQHLKMDFGKISVLRDINLQVQTGEIVGLIGPSGAGKTSTIKAMLGMEKASGGSALVLGHTMPNRRILGHIGYMAQSDALYDSLTCAQNLQFFGKMKGVPKNKLAQEIQYVSSVVDLTPYLQLRVKNFSGGMKRRLSLAIALLGKPSLLVLDEPTVGIDPALRRQIWHELSKLRDQGVSVLITTHVMDEAERTNKVALLLAGKIIAFASPAELKKQYQVETIEDVFLKAEKEADHENTGNY